MNAKNIISALKLGKFNLVIAIIFNFQFSIFNLFAQNQREKYNFNSDWEIFVGEQSPDNNLTGAKVTLPHAFNEDEAFRVSIYEHTDTVVWYRKHFRLPQTATGQKIFLEFEGIKWGGEFFINGKSVGIHENGVMAFGFDITDYIDYDKENTVLARIDNSWKYREQVTGQTYQWNDKNFNANYGGIPKNVYLHVTPRLYQTLPLYSNLQTTGTYIYAREIDITKKSAMIYAESEIKNEFPQEKSFTLEMKIEDMDGKIIKTVQSEFFYIAAGETKTVKVGDRVNDLHFWSWGYGYLYNIYTIIKSQENITDVVKTRTGFRKTRFADGMIWLNDRVIQIKGYAERSSNEWAATGISVPAWLSDYSNRLMVQSGANTVRWMHVTPWKQDVESCDRVGLMQLLPAGDSEKDVFDRRWGQRTELMRDAIIYNRNNPSVVFYEGGNESISEEHMAELKAIRDKYDPYGGRAIGSREMLDSKIAEYGGEMLYINKSAKHPLFATEYCRDEALRLYWDANSYPFHPDGYGIKYVVGKPIDTSTMQWKDMIEPSKNAFDAAPYNRNQDSFFRELITRWNDYFRVRPGTGKRMSSGGLKIHFHDSNTHYRGAENYRRSGVVDAMRIPKDAYFAHQIMWNGWVDTEKHGTYICGHWNYEQTQESRTKSQDSVLFTKDVYICSTGDSVVLFVNNKKYTNFERSDNFLFTFKNIKWEKGYIEALSYDKNGKEVSRTKKETAGTPDHLKLTPIFAPDGFKTDGADLAMVEVEVVDKAGRRCPLANDMISFTLEGEADYILADHLPSYLERGETPSTPSFSIKRKSLEIVAATAGYGEDKACNAFDDNELSEWQNDGKLSTGWIKFELAYDALVSQVEMKLTGWRMRSYPIEIYVDDTKVWEGETEKSLGYVALDVKPAKGRFVTVKLTGAADEKDAFGGIVEVAAKQAGELDLFRDPNAANAKGQLRIVEMEVYGEFEYKFDFSGKKVQEGVIAVDENTVFGKNSDYGYDFLPAPAKNSKTPFFFSIRVPDGNYLVTVRLGSKKQAGLTTVRAEQRRLFVNNCATRKGEIVEKTFVVNKRSTRISENERVKIKAREKDYLTWDDRLTLEFNGADPVCESITIKPAPDSVTTVYLCGNSTVVDQRNEPWASWGQMIPHFFDSGVCIANYAESGESASSFMAAGRLKKILSHIKEGDYLFIEFGHNDEKDKRPGNGAYFSFMTNLKIFIDEARARGANPVLITPTARRQFINDKINDTHGEYDDAVRFLAEKENVPLIDLTAMTTALYESMGNEESKKLLVHYPANTFPNQPSALADNTHFSAFGAFEAAKLVISKLQNTLPELASHLNSKCSFDPTEPDNFDAFHWDLCPFFETIKPDGD